MFCSRNLGFQIPFSLQAIVFVDNKNIETTELLCAPCRRLGHWLDVAERLHVAQWLHVAQEWRLPSANQCETDLMGAEKTGGQKLEAKPAILWNARDL